MFNDGLYMHSVHRCAYIKAVVYGKKQKTLNIIQRTSTHYINLAMFLLNDENCDIVHILEIQYQHDPERIVREVFKKWLSGTGKKPVTWKTLVDVLRDIQLNSLAYEIDTALK